jgi:hemoglobin-like flavoprotein
MTLGPDMASELRRTWSLVAADVDAAVELFYGNLFAASPALQPLFADTAMGAQRRKLAAALAFVVSAPDLSGATATALRDLGGRHLGYGVRAEHYDDVGRALISTLEQALGKAFTPSAGAAWTAAYAAVAAPLREGAALAALALVEA